MAVEDLTSVEGIVALAAVGVALVALVLAVVLAVKLRRVRAAQSAVLGGYEQRDLVAHAQGLQDGFVALRDWVEEALGSLERRSQDQDHRIAGCIAHRAVIRYDAYGEMSGQQSTSLALLDPGASGVVVSSILHRDQARVYVKQVDAGRSGAQLSPEEEQAIEVALATPPQPAEPSLATPPDPRQRA